jgi:tetratricopeptide (TPR) repeat protein
MEESRALRRQQGALEEDPRLLEGLAALAVNEGDYAQAAALLQQNLRIYREYEEAGRDFDRNGLGCTLDLLGGLAYCGGEFPSARSYYEQSLALSRELDDKTGIASAFLGLGGVAMRQGEHSRARALLQESLALFRDVKAKHSAIGVLNSLAWIGWHEGEFATARAHLVESLMLCGETGRYQESIDTLVSAGQLALRQESAERAVRLFGAAEVLRAAIQRARPPVERAEFEDAMTAARAALDEEAYAAAWAEGQAMTRDQAVRFALEEMDA